MGDQSSFGVHLSHQEGNQSLLQKPIRQQNLDLMAYGVVDLFRVLQAQYYPQQPGYENVGELLRVLIFVDFSICQLHHYQSEPLQCAQLVGVPS